MSKAVKTVGFIFVMILLSKIAGQLREILLAYHYGTSYEAAAFTAASQIPLYFFDIIFASAISSSFIPVFNDIAQKQSKKEAMEFAASFINYLFIASSAVVILFSVFSTPIINATFGGLTSDALCVADRLIKILFPTIILAAVAFSLAGLLQSLGEFNIPAMMSLVSNAVVIIYFFTLNRYYGITGLAVSLLIGWVLQLLILIPPSINKGYIHRFVRPPSRDIKTVLILALPVMLATCVTPVNSMVNLAVASSLSQGQAVPALNYANKLFIIVSTVFAMALSNYIFPFLSRLNSSGDNEGHKKLLKMSADITIFILLPLSSGLISLSLPVIKLIYERGAFDSSATLLTKTAFMWYCSGIAFAGLNEIFNKALYSKKNTKAPAFAAFLGMAVNAALSITLSRFTGIAGVALANTVSLSVVCGVLIFSLSKSRSGLFDTADIAQVLKLLVSAVIAGIAGYIMYASLSLLFDFKPISDIINMILCASTGMLIYFGFAVIFKNETALYITKKLRARLG